MPRTNNTPVQGQLNLTVARGSEAEGLRFVCRDNAFAWRHALEMLPGDTDCTDMSDAEFEEFAAAITAGSGALDHFRDAAEMVGPNMEST